jgi:hypothetical protein
MSSVCGSTMKLSWCYSPRETSSSRSEFDWILTLTASLQRHETHYPNAGPGNDATRQHHKASARCCTLSSRGRGDISLQRRSLRWQRPTRSAHGRIRKPKRSARPRSTAAPNEALIKWVKDKGGLLLRETGASNWCSLRSCYSPREGRPFRLLALGVNSHFAQTKPLRVKPSYGRPLRTILAKILRTPSICRTVRVCTRPCCREGTSIALRAAWRRRPAGTRVLSLPSS